MNFTKIDIAARNMAVAAYRKKHHRMPQADAKLCEPFMHLSRHQLAKLVDRERMRSYAEVVRRRKTSEDKARMIEARASYESALNALAARDRLYGKP